ncbi:hypothetical protein PG990_001622 [Apiospora arundinis]|uniref:Uncharacterized protein n=1 Tax=Apiospora arundinis TaxID=335852 RepID=A0ABR2HS36_9PEZI
MAHFLPIDETDAALQYEVPEHGLHFLFPLHLQPFPPLYGVYINSIPWNGWVSLELGWPGCVVMPANAMVLFGQGTYMVTTVYLMNDPMHLFATNIHHIL